MQQMRQVPLVGVLSTQPEQKQPRTVSVLPHFNNSLVTLVCKLSFNYIVQCLSDIHPAIGIHATATCHFGAEGCKFMFSNWCFIQKLTSVKDLFKKGHCSLLFKKKKKKVCHNHSRIMLKNKRNCGNL